MWLGRQERESCFAHFKHLDVVWKCKLSFLVLRTETSVNFSEMARIILLMGQVLPHFKAWEWMTSLKEVLRICGKADLDLRTVKNLLVKASQWDFTWGEHLRVSAQILRKNYKPLKMFFIKRSWATLNQPSHWKSFTSTWFLLAMPSLCLVLKRLWWEL